MLERPWGSQFDLDDRNIKFLLVLTCSHLKHYKRWWSKLIVKSGWWLETRSSESERGLRIKITSRQRGEKKKEKETNVSVSDISKSAYSLYVYILCIYIYIKGSIVKDIEGTFVTLGKDIDFSVLLRMSHGIRSFRHDSFSLHLIFYLSFLFSFFLPSFFRSFIPISRIS